MNYLHNCGILLGGVKPNDILIDPNSLEIKFRSFEGAIMMNNFINEKYKAIYLEEVKDESH